MDKAAAVAAVVGSYKTLAATSDGQHRSSWVAFSESAPTVYQKCLKNVCHMSMWSCPQGCDTLITNFKVRDPELDLKWFDFLKTKLYRRFSDHINLEQTEEGDYYLCLTGLDILPANVVYNICITSRAIVEFRNNLTIWSNLIDKGIDPTVAFLFMGSNAKGQTDVKVTSLYDNVYNSNHWAFDNWSIPEVIFNGGDPHNFAAPFKEYPRGVTPCNKIWGYTNRGMCPLVGQTIAGFNDSIKAKAATHEDVLQSP